ncbi:MAG TPA: HAD family hydrolase [Patescibacteria group bacterium]|nr:HAD family hydrolase [Patescibacteria group bacterium]
MHKLTIGPRFDQKPSGKPRLILTDIDNTLLPNESRDLPTEKVTQIFRDVAKKLPVGVITARPPQTSIYLIEHLEITGLSIFSNGAQIYDGKTKQMLVEYSLSISLTNEIMQKLTDKKIGYWVQDDGIDYHSPDYEWDQLPKNYVPKKPFIIVAKYLHEHEIDIVHELIKKYHESNVTSFVAHARNNEKGETVYDMFIADKRSNKAAALHEISQRTTIPLSDFLAIGDGHNDRVLLESVGWGVAMGNAVPEVKEVATFIAPNRKEDGAARALEELLNL